MGLELRGMARVIDGDTLDLAVAGGDPVRIRLHGIDAPEAGQPCPGGGGDGWACGDWASATAAALAAGPLGCTRTDIDRYGRVVAVCHDAAGQDLGAALVAAGAATAYVEYSAAYLPEERRARAAGLGIWATPGMIAPAAFRAGGAASPDAASPDAGAPTPGCAIKGNLSGNGAIYHRPGQRDYARTRIERSRGERWFCSTVEAEAAGWSAARR